MDTAEATGALKLEAHRNVAWELARIRRSGPVLADSISVSCDNGLLSIGFQIKTDKILGEIETSILDVEPVVFHYASVQSVGRQAPHVVSGRDDFPRDLQHLISGSPTDPAIFCLARSGLQPLYEHTGIEGVISRLVDWFRDAKTKTFHADGWEPVPVVWPETHHILGYIDSAALQEYAADHSNGGYAYIAAHLSRSEKYGDFLHAENDPIDIENVDVVERVRSLFKIMEDDNSTFIPAVFVWGASNDSDFRPHFSTWIDIDSFVSGIKEAGLYERLASAMQNLSIKFGTNCEADKAGNRVCLVIVGIWRPIKIDPTIVGLSTDQNARRLELRAFYLKRPVSDYLGSWDSLSLLQPFIGMVPAIPDMLEAVSGETSMPEFSIVGLGAIGSAWLDYSVRGGCRAVTVFDDDKFLAHNIARHRGGRSHVRYAKSDVASALAADRVEGVEIRQRFVDFVTVSSEDLASELASSSLIVDASANAQVRRKLSSPLSDDLWIARTEIFFKGRLGVTYLTKSGWHQNLTMMHMQLIASAEHQSVVQEWLRYEASRSFLDDELLLGFGCATMTTRMPAYKVDAHASASFAFCRKHVTYTEEARVLLNKLDDHGLPISSIEWTPDSVRVFGPDNTTSEWKVLFSEGVIQTLHRQRKEAAPNETGGYLFGGIDEALSEIYIVAASSEPPGSEASPTFIKLGPWGRTGWEKSFVRRTKGRLSVVGTWHSHPVSSAAASSTDWKTVEGFVAEDQLRAIPTVFAITGYDEDRVYVLDGTKPSNQKLS